MGRHRPKWRCVICQRVRTPQAGMVCAKCRRLTPWYEESSDPSGHWESQEDDAGPVALPWESKEGDAGPLRFPPPNGLGQE